MWANCRCHQNCRTTLVSTQMQRACKIGRRLERTLDQALALHHAPLSETVSRHGVPCGPALDAGEALLDHHTIARGMILWIGHYRGIASSIKIARTPATAENLRAQRRGEGPRGRLRARL
ncbi:hypothetical protein HCN50_32430 [Bradyrhizobium sp. WSM 1744]|uniref:Uncharacterized protein n=1 Tax=Bradyrhizobium archetypum TaxID=2721160 RepID=A0A7Y4HB23_9BRAD|nr:hypothetical protein [Bradyrhizobium archetypum]